VNGVSTVEGAEFDMSGMGRLPDGEVTGTAHGMAAQA
jgi:hypothetical protein